MFHLYSVGQFLDYQENRQVHEHSEKEIDIRTNKCTIRRKDRQLGKWMENQVNNQDRQMDSKTYKDRLLDKKMDSQDK